MSQTTWRRFPVPLRWLRAGGDLSRRDHANQRADRALMGSTPPPRSPLRASRPRTAPYPGRLAPASRPPSYPARQSNPHSAGRPRGAPNFPRLRALALFGHRPPEQEAPLVMPASKNLHKVRHLVPVSHRDETRVSTRTGRCQGTDAKVVGAQSERLGVRRLAPPSRAFAAIEIERAVLLGFSEGCPMSAFFAAANPERVSKLILCGGFAKAFSTEEAVSQRVKIWGTGALMGRAAAKNLARRAVCHDARCGVNGNAADISVRAKNRASHRRGSTRRLFTQAMKAGSA